MSEKIVNYEDEIDLRELIKTLWIYKYLILIFTSFITILSIIYVLQKNPTPIYKGSLYMEIGTIQDKNFQPVIIENVNDLAYILNLEFDVKAVVPKEVSINKYLQTKLIEISFENEDKNKIRETLEKIKDYIIEKHKKDTKYYENIIMTKQIGDIKISNEDINKPKKALIVAISFVTAFILSIFLAFLIDFVKREYK
ncbi:Wzz/FepE/Etk N-terminal domain-containing protein [Aliarcobacter sp. ERUVET-7]|jgi:capsular polysaccharide biosynthesis protein|uniref:Wzz/FepE/Etk N-terminal domain-containing protein n=1 Tax=Aliarcobacter TaxID=2321111 RepID=UPI0021B183E7|nr:Wzz/FepE/Etk N-terminal domain-containing protein [Aliarcobacter cryaerophilus]MCT7486338.1 Wzz/FepE/Etk N-terminal domain-containing protein [Aliarcobacter cryaerophilus]MCT7490401.1 Wzz/FepE/Etk N-terminal domain-containing protein [Aliarcobacter cryaerophilus]MCT7499897.1 Wzz/FepE/Etk N-terminal domain-containing protein [Aliarcobacter cryaerophilus]MCT7544092.1 Wzz/FepE/Etk N-terminal domain-containing protein [Aliarcobacter cryaerophilus]